MGCNKQQMLLHNSEVGDCVDCTLVQCDQISQSNPKIFPVDIKVRYCNSIKTKPHNSKVYIKSQDATKTNDLP